jgi:chemotaxis protein MotA
VTTIIGLLAGFVLIIAAMSMGGTPLSFVDLPSVIIVLGGTAAMTVVSFTFNELKDAPRAIWHMITHPRADPAYAAETVLRLADRARKDGVLNLEHVSRSLSDDPFLHRAIRLVADGANPEDAEKLLKTETFAISTMHMNSINILRRAAEVAPAMGLIGTLVGLVQMLGSLDDPSTIGPAMAVALLTTFYGAMLAHMLFLPLASRAERSAREEALLNSVYTIGAAGIGRRDNPRHLETLINTILPPAKRVQFYG